MLLWSDDEFCHKRGRVFFLLLKGGYRVVLTQGCFGSECALSLRESKGPEDSSVTKTCPQSLSCCR